MLSLGKASVTLGELWTYSTPGDTVSSVSVPDKPSEAVILWAFSANLWSSGYWNTTPPDITLFPAQSSEGARQAVFLDEGTGSISGRAFVPGSVSTTGVGVIMLQLSIDS